MNKWYSDTLAPETRNRLDVYLAVLSASSDRQLPPKSPTTYTTYQPYPQASRREQTVLLPSPSHTPVLAQHRQKYDLPRYSGGFGANMEEEAELVLLEQRLQQTNRLAGRMTSTFNAASYLSLYPGLP